VELHFDDLSWIEWRSPWLDGDTASETPGYATHVMFQPKP
jgi:hypothetical protein